MHERVGLLRTVGKLAEIVWIAGASWFEGAVNLLRRLTGREPR